MDNLQRLKETAAVVESCLDKYLPLRDTYEKTIYEAMRYSALGGGKRIRGVLTLMSCMMAGGKAEDAYPFAAAIEMIHAYSLIHDDLPAMDNDDFRRGKPTNHKKFGEAMAILAGDGLLGLAFETVLKNAPAEDKTWDALKLMSMCAGPDGMLGGQVVDHQITAGVLIQTAYDVQHRRFSAAGRTQNGYKFTFPKLQAHTTQRLYLSAAGWVVFLNVDQFKHWIYSFSMRPYEKVNTAHYFFQL